MSIADITSESQLRRAANHAPFRVALIGCGAIAEQMHLPVLAGLNRLRLTALVDRHIERARRYAKGYGVNHVLDDAAKLSHDLVDAAIIATPPSHHAPCALDLIGKGIHVLVEKPMATTMADAERMAAAAEQACVVLSVGFFRRLFPSIRLLKSLVDSGWAGAPLRFDVQGGGMYGWNAATLANMQREQAGGGVLMDFGSHMLDLLLAVFDEPAEVLDYRDNSLGGVEADCTIDLRLRHAGESLDGRVELARTRALDSRIRIECERATLEFHVSERFRIKVTPHDVELAWAPPQDAGRVQFDAFWQGEARDEHWFATFARQFDDFARAIDTGSEPILSARSALATSRLIDACYGQRRQAHEPWVECGSVSPGHSRLTTPGERLTPHVGGAGGRILVTGASGFIGCRVAEVLRLREKCDVRALVHNPANVARLARLDVELVQGDLESTADLRRVVEGCDGIVHCAIGTTYGEPRRMYDVTVNGTRRLAAAAAAAGVRRLVHVSTRDVYGHGGAVSERISEESPVAPARENPYGQSKAAAEKAVMKAVNAGLSAVIMRPSRVFGPFSRTFVVNPLTAMQQGRFAWLGSPDVSADMVYVDNVVEALLYALWADPARVTGEAFNVGEQRDDTWRDFYTYFAGQLACDPGDFPIVAPRIVKNRSKLAGYVSLPARVFRGVGQIVASQEFKALGRRVLLTDPIGYGPRTTLQRYPSLERGVRRLIRADDSMPAYRETAAPCDSPVAMGSDGKALSIAKLRERLGYMPSTSWDDALELTMEWVRYARVAS